MKLSQPSSQIANDGSRPKGEPGLVAERTGFTLVEMLVVIAIIGIIAALGVPAFKAFRSSDIMGAATRQMLQEIAFARQTALATRSTVYMVFVDHDLVVNTLPASYDARERKVITNLWGGQFRSYAIISKRTVGDQPGQNRPRYITGWRTLPEGTFLATNKFNFINSNRFPSDITTNIYDRVFDRVKDLPFPTENSLPYSSLGSPDGLACLTFNSQGQLISEVDPKSKVYGDAMFQISKGSLITAKDAAGNYLPKGAAIAEVKTRGTNTFNSDDPHFVRISWLTGKPRVERAELQ